MLNKCVCVLVCLFACLCVKGVKWQENSESLKKAKNNNTQAAAIKVINTLDTSVPQFGNVASFLSYFCMQ